MLAVGVLEGLFVDAVLLYYGLVPVENGVHASGGS